MIHLTKRQNEIINHLINSKEYITRSEISYKLKISESTVYREINSINAMNPKEEIILSSRGNGYKINYPIYISVFMTDKDDAKKDAMAYDRFRLMIIYLLLSSPRWICVHELIDALFSSRSSIMNDLIIVREFIKKYHLTLDRKSGDVRIIGDEIQLRILLNETYFNLLVNNNMDYKPNLHQHVEVAGLLLIDIREIDQIQEIIIQNSLKFGIIIDNPYFINLIIKILILEKRYSFGMVHLPFQEFSYPKDHILHKFSMSLLSDLQRVFRHIHTDEIFYLEAILKASLIFKKDDYRLMHQHLLNTDSRLLNTYLIQEMEKKYEVDIMMDQEMTDLWNEMVSNAIYRIQQNINIYMPMDYYLQRRYESLQQVIKQLLERYMENRYLKKYEDYTLQEEAIQFAYFFKPFLNHLSRSYKVTLISSLGIYRTRGLKKEIEKRFLNIDITEMIPYQGFDKKTENCYVITTIKVDLLRSVQISPAFNEEDQRMIEEYLRKEQLRRDKK